LPNTIKNFNCFYNPLVALPILPVPVETMKYVELFRDGYPPTFDEELQYYAECVEIISTYNLTNDFSKLYRSH
jgi:hypothetical protein